MQLQNAKKAVGIDFSNYLLERSRKRLSNKKNIELHFMHAENLSFKDESFDYVVCLDASLGNMPGIESDIIKEMTRVCRKGGEIIVSVFSENAKQAQFENYIRLGFKNLYDDGQAWHADRGWYSRRFTKNDLKGLFKKAGLKCEIIKICPINYAAFAKKQ